MLSTEAAALALLCGDLNLEDSEALLSDVALLKFELNQNTVLPLCHFFGRLAKLGLS